MSQHIVHVVSFRYRPDATSERRESLFRDFVALRRECLLPSSEAAGAGAAPPAVPPPSSEASAPAPYILDIRAGDENVSPEGAGKGFHHIFVLTFACRSHLDYYLDHDPAHVAFKAKARELVEDAFIFDFDPKPAANAAAAA